MIYKIKNFLLIFFVLLFCKENCFANEVVAIKTYDRDSYIRVMFETTEKPSYFVNQKNNNIYVKLPKINANDTIIEKFFKLGVIENIKLEKNIDGVVFIISVVKGSNLKRYLYTEPSDISNYYRVIVDIYRSGQTMDEILSKIDVEKDVSKNMDDLIERNVKTNEKTLDDIITNNVKANDMNELLVLNNIINEKK